jgi:hypothetical protein
MSNRARIKASKRVKKETNPKYKEEVTLVTKHTNFNIFTKDGANRQVKSPRPMTLDEAMSYFDCLCIGADD